MLAFETVAKISFIIIPRSCCFRVVAFWAVAEILFLSCNGHIYPHSIVQHRAKEFICFACMLAVLGLAGHMMKGERKYVHPRRAEKS